MIPNARNSILYWKVPRLRPLVLLIRLVNTMLLSMAHWWHGIGKENPNYAEKNLYL